MEADRRGNIVNWFPGHMAKTRRIFAENIRLVDIVAEIADARIPVSSRNPDLESLIPPEKPRILLLNKADLADSAANDAWLFHYKKAGFHCMTINSKNKGSAKGFYRLAKAAAEDILKKRSARKITDTSLRIMVAGIPNVGKSTIINTLAGSKRAKTEDRPGVTRGKQWVSLGGGFELLDMPGLLWPKIETERQGLFLAYTGAVRDEVLDIEHIAACLLEELSPICPKAIESRYNLQEIENKSGLDLLRDIGTKRGFLLLGGVVDTERAAKMVLDEFRAAKISRITLEHPTMEP